MNRIPDMNDRKSYNPCQSDFPGVQPIQAKKSAESSIFDPRTRHFLQVYASFGGGGSV